MLHNKWFKDDNYITVYYAPLICWWTSELICPSEWVCPAPKLKWQAVGDLWANDMGVMLSANWPSLSPFRGAQKETQTARRQSAASEPPERRQRYHWQRTEGYEQDNRDVCQYWLIQECDIFNLDKNYHYFLFLNDFYREGNSELDLVSPGCPLIWFDTLIVCQIKGGEW